MALRKLENPSSKVETECASPSIFPIQEACQASFYSGVFEFFAIASRKPPTYTMKKDEQEEIIRGKFHQNQLIKVKKNEKKNDLCTVDLVSYLSKHHLLTDNALTFGTDYLRELNQGQRREVEILEISQQSMYQNVKKGKITNDPVSTLPLRILLKLFEQT